MRLADPASPKVYAAASARQLDPRLRGDDYLFFAEMTYKFQA